MSDTAEWKGRRLGAYVVGERFSDIPEDEGRLYAAHHVETGEPAMVLRPGTSGDWRMSMAWRAETTFFSDPEALVFHPRRERGVRWPRFHSWSLSSIYLAGALAQLDEREDVRVHSMSRPQPVRARRRSLRWGLAGAGAALVAGLALWLWPSTAKHPEPRGAIDDTFVFADGQEGPAGIAYPMPEKPFEVQRKPPCIPRREEEIRGGCWIRHRLDVPCPPGTAEYQGGCYMPVKKPDPEPTSVQP